MAAVEVMLFRKDNPDGTQKDWAYVVPVTASTTYTVFFGRTGTMLRSTQVAASRPANAAQARADEKLANGYRSLGRHLLAANRQTLTPLGSSPEPATPPTPALYWSWLPRPGQVEAYRDAFRTALADARLRLEAVGWLDPEAPLLAAVRIGLSLERLGSRQDGRVLLTEDQQQEIALLLMLGRRCPALRIVNDAQEAVTDWPVETLPVAATVLETLGLTPLADLRAWFSSGVDETAVWFF